MRQVWPLSKDVVTEVVDLFPRKIIFYSKHSDFYGACEWLRALLDSLKTEYVGLLYAFFMAGVNSDKENLSIKKRKWIFTMFYLGFFACLSFIQLMKKKNSKNSLYIQGVISPLEIEPLLIIKIRLDYSS